MTSGKAGFLVEGTGRSCELSADSASSRFYRLKGSGDGPPGSPLGWGW